MKNKVGILGILVAILVIGSLIVWFVKNSYDVQPPVKITAGQSLLLPQNTPMVEPAKEAESEKYFQLGLKAYEQYKYQEAASNYDKAIAANPANYKVYTAKGIDLCFEEDYQGGMALIQKTLAMNPDYVPAFYDMAMAYKLQHQYDQSLYWFQRTIQGDPQNTWSYYGIATIYADRGNTIESLKYLKKAIDLDPGVKAVAREQAHFDQMRNLPEFQALVQH
jgi:tetratricopeptide (TPR) repeat protein